MRSGGFAHGVGLLHTANLQGSGTSAEGRKKTESGTAPPWRGRELDAKVDVGCAGGGDVAGEEVAALGVVDGESGVFERVGEGSGVVGHDGGVVGDDATATQIDIGGDFIQSRGDAELKRRRAA